MTAPTLGYWLGVVVWISLGVGCLVGAAWWIERVTRAARLRRLSWQVATCATLLLVACELAGLTHVVAEWGARRPVVQHDEEVQLDESVERARTSTQTAVPVSTRELSTTRSFRSQPVDAAGSRVEVESAASVESGVRSATWLAVLAMRAGWWPAHLWLAACLVIGFRFALDHVRLARHLRRCRPVSVGGVTARVDRVARRLGLRARIRIVEWSGARSPVACGWFRWTLGLPTDFEARFDPGQQEAVLAHELAHLRDADPLWHAVADVVVGILWWQPLARVLRSRLRAASEAAADEASLVIEQGPQRLAESLLAVGRDHARSAWSAAVRADGAPYRSNLGRRVERLLSLRDTCWRPSSRASAWAVRMVVPWIAIAFLAVAGSGARAWLAIDEPPLGDRLRVVSERDARATGGGIPELQGDRQMKISTAIRGSILGGVFAVALAQGGDAAGASAEPPKVAESSRPSERTDPPIAVQRGGADAAERTNPAADPAGSQREDVSSARVAPSSASEHVTVVVRFALAEIPEPVVLQLQGGLALQAGPGTLTRIKAQSVRFVPGDSSNPLRLELDGGVEMESGPANFWLITCDDPSEEVFARVREWTADSDFVRYFALPLASGQYGDIIFSNPTAYIREFEIERSGTAFIADPVVDVLQTGMLFSALAEVEDDGKIRLGLDIEFSQLEELEERRVDIAGATVPVTIQEPKLTSGKWSVERVLEDGGRALLMLSGFEPDHGRGAIFIELVVRRQQGPKARISIDANRD